MGCKNTRSSNQVFESMQWRFGIQHCRSLAVPADVGGDLSGKYFTLNLLDGEQVDANQDYAEVNYQVWLNNGSGTAPTVLAGYTLLEVVYSDDDTGNVIAGEIKSAFDSDPVISKLLKTFPVEGNKLEYQNRFIGVISPEDASDIVGAVLTVDVEGFGGSLGSVASGGASLTTDIVTQELKDDQNGEIVLDEIITGITNTISFSLLEMTTDRWEALIGNVVGGKVVKNSERIIGWGSKKLYSSLFELGGVLVGHPVRLPYSDRSADISMYTAPNMTNINFSGSEVQVAEFEFKAYKDLTVDEEVNLCRRGDYTLLEA